MISGAHVIVYSKNPDADRTFFQETLGLSHVDVGGGWLIFGLPPSEVAVHPGKKNGVQELYLMCDDVNAFVEAMNAKDIACSGVKDQGWGLLTTVTLPGGGELGVYEPRHQRPGIKSAPSKAKTKQAASAKSRGSAVARSAGARAQGSAGASAKRKSKPVKKAPARKR